MNLKILEDGLYYKSMYIKTSLVDNIKILYEKELRNIGFVVFQEHNYVFQERPKVGETVLIAIKPYIGRYERGQIKRILTSVSQA